MKISLVVYCLFQYKDLQMKFSLIYGTIKFKMKYILIDVSKDEVNNFMKVICAMGLNHQPEIMDYFGEKSLNHIDFGTLMQYD